MLHFNCLSRHLGQRQKLLDTTLAACLAVYQRLSACTPAELAERVVCLLQKPHCEVM